MIWSDMDSFRDTVGYRSIAAINDRCIKMGTVIADHFIGSLHIFQIWIFGGKMIGKKDEIKTVIQTTGSTSIS